MQITQDLSKIKKKNPENSFVGIVMSEMCAKFQWKKLKPVVLGLFNFLDKKTIELWLSFCMGFCITVLVIPNYKKISP